MELRYAQIGHRRSMHACPSCDRVQPMLPSPHPVVERLDASSLEVTQQGDPMLLIAALVAVAMVRPAA
eukprot:4863997-Prymnesium_polylepis.1